MEYASFRILILPVVKKGKARKYLRIAIANEKRKPRVISKYKVLNLKEYKQAKISNMLGTTRLVTKVAGGNDRKHDNEAMASAEDS